jgi:hypothetical protein
MKATSRAHGHVDVADAEAVVVPLARIGPRSRVRLN